MVIIMMLIKGKKKNNFKLFAPLVFLLLRPRLNDDSARVEAVCRVHLCFFAFTLFRPLPRLASPAGTPVWALSEAAGAAGGRREMSSDVKQADARKR